MPRQLGTYAEYNFSKGLITEASPLGYPENSCPVTFDCVHKATGDVERRLGLEMEVNNSIKQIDRTDSVINSYLWKDVAGNGNISIVVLQVGNNLYFYEASASLPLSSKAFSQSIDLTAFSPAGAKAPKNSPCQFATGKGKLFVVHPNLEAFAVSYNPSNATFSTSQIDILIRDMEGVVDNLDIDERPTASLAGMTIPHHYNLLNQGWTNANLTSWDTSQTTMPSNADVMWAFKNADNAFDTATIPNVVNGNSPAAKGHFILNAFSKDRSAASGLSINAETTGTERCSAVAFFAGRVFYSGINYDGHNSKIFFSQIIESNTQFGLCYQVNDPSAEDFFDLLPSDGGVIEIQEAGTIIKLANVPGGLAVFASNGVWFITGSTGLGFTANDYVVSPISSLPALSASSFVDVAGIPIWWTLDGIYRLEPQGNGYVANPISYTTIRTFYNDIPVSEKKNATGTYNAIGGLVQWMYRSTPSGSVTQAKEYDRILVLDVITGGFYVWTLPNQDVKLHSPVVIASRGGGTELSDVIDGSANTILTNASDNVVAWTLAASVVTPTFKYVASYVDGSGNTQFSFAEARLFTYVDFPSISQTDYTSYLISGMRLKGDAIRNFQSNYVEFYSDNNSTFQVQGVWDFANAEESIRWSRPQLISTVDKTNFDYVPSKRKIRGRGKALQLKITSEQGKPFRILGWSVFASINTTV